MTFLELDIAALGPQGEQVVAFIERSYTVAGDPRNDERWTGDWYTVWSESWDTAHAAAYDAITAQPERWWAMTSHEDSQAWGALFDEVMALVVRDLIPFEYYDTLTLVSRCLFGPIHPDDPQDLAPNPSMELAARAYQSRGLSRDLALTAAFLETSCG